MKMISTLIGIMFLFTQCGGPKVEKQFYYDGDRLYVFRDDKVWLNYHNAHDYGGWPPNNKGIWESDGDELLLWSASTTMDEYVLTEEYNKAIQGLGFEIEKGMSIENYDRMKEVDMAYIDKFCSILSEHEAESRLGKEPTIIPKKGSFIVVRGNTYTLISEEDFLNLNLRHPVVK